MSVELSGPRQSIGDRYPSARPARGGADGSSGGPAGAGSREIAGTPTVL
jgi:hypothetical protein